MNSLLKIIFYSLAEFIKQSGHHKNTIRILWITIALLGIGMVIVPRFIITARNGTSIHNPLDQKELRKMKSTIRGKRRTEEMAKTVYAEDLVIKQFYFRYQSQIKIGSIILLITGICLTLVMKILTRFKRPTPDPMTLKPEKASVYGFASWCMCLWGGFLIILGYMLTL